MALPKLFERIFWHNNTTPEINEDNLNSMSKAVDDIDNRVIQISGDILEVVPQIQAYLEQAEDLVEAIELMTENPPYIGANGHWYVWDTNTEQYVDSGIDASITVDIADITMLATDASPYVTNTGTSTDPIFHLYIPRGETGNGIASIAKTGTSGLVDTYTITFTNGQTTTFTVTNGGGMQIDGSNADSFVNFSGAFTVGERNDSAIGTNSMTQGNNNVASGLYSFARGDSTVATGINAYAEGLGGGFADIVTVCNDSIGQVMNAGDRITRRINGFLPDNRVVFYVNNTLIYDGLASDIGYNVIGNDGNYSAQLSKASLASGFLEIRVDALVNITSASTKIPVKLDVYTNSNAMGVGSHTEGDYCFASGDYSHAEGLSTKTIYSYQHVSGTYNDNKKGTAFEVGNGSDENSRSNAFEVYKDGSISTDNGVTKVRLEDLEVKPVILTQTLQTGNTEVMFTDSAITSTAMYDVYTDMANLSYKEIDDSISGTIKVKFEAQQSQVTVMLVIK